MKYILAVFLFLMPLALRAEIVAGRPVDPEHSFSAGLSMGQITDIQGSVQETTRRLFVVTGEPERQKDQDNYNFEELGLSESETMYGFTMEKMWKYVTLRFDFATLEANAKSVADRDFFISVDEIEFRGQTYEHQKLENDIPYEASLEGYIATFGVDITPFTINPDGAVQATPWLHLGVLGVYAEFETDQGPPVRLQVYENPPETYVVGGHGEGDEVVASPEIGLGGELKFKFGERLGRPVALALQGTYSILEFHGDTGDIGIDTDKDLDLEYECILLRAQFEIPITAAADLLAGASYRLINIDATSKAKERSLEETLARREKFDKDIELELTMVTGFVGVRW